MLTQNSYLAFDTFSPYTKHIKGNLKKLWSLFESVDIDYEIISVKDQKRQYHIKAFQIIRLSINIYKKIS